MYQRNEHAENQQIQQQFLGDGGAHKVSISLNVNQYYWMLFTAMDRLWNIYAMLFAITVRLV